VAPPAAAAAAAARALVSNCVVEDHEFMMWFDFGLSLKV
jgi:hypothetical protein